MKTSKIIQQCIDEKWIPILNLEGYDKGISNCILCQEFLLYGKCNTCIKCPLKIEGYGCDDERGVYADFSVIESNYPRASIQYRKVAQNMISMLKKVRDIYKKKGD